MRPLSGVGCLALVAAIAAVPVIVIGVLAIAVTDDDGPPRRDPPYSIDDALRAFELAGLQVRLEDGSSSLLDPCGVAAGLVPSEPGLGALLGNKYEVRQLQAAGDEDGAISFQLWAFVAYGLNSHVDDEEDVELMEREFAINPGTGQSLPRCAALDGFRYLVEKNLILRFEAAPTNARLELLLFAALAEIH